MGKARGRHASLTALVDHMEQTAIDPERRPYLSATVTVSRRRSRWPTMCANALA